MENFISYCAENAEWVLPIILLILGEIIVRFIPTKDPAGLTERIGKIIGKVLDNVSVKNARKSFQGKTIDQGKGKK